MSIKNFNDGLEAYKAESIDLTINLLENHGYNCWRNNKNYMLYSDNKYLLVVQKEHQKYSNHVQYVKLTDYISLQ